MFSQHNTCPILMNIGLGIKFIIEIGFTCKLLVLGGTLDFDFFNSPCWMSCFDSQAEK